MTTLDLSDVPSFCSHEHWGSIDAIGMLPEGFRADVESGAVPTRPVSLFDILLDPYFRGLMASVGDDPAVPAGLANVHAWAAQAPQDVWRALRPAIARQQLTGTYQCIRRGIETLYSVDIAAPNFDIAALNAAIAQRYAHIFAWYRETMRRAHFSALIRPVHPEFYMRAAQSAASALEELVFTHTILRIDPLLDLWRADCLRRDLLAAITGVDPQDAETWRGFLAAIFELAQRGGTTGIKQLQAYSRTLDFAVRDDAAVRWRGDLTPDQVAVFKDWVVNECCRLANERAWPHQVHVGTHNLAHSSPLPLSALATRYPKMKIVLLHCWPFLKESGWLAKHHANVYLDTCWMPVLNPAFYLEAITEWLNYVPAHKITCGHDSTSVEMAVGSARFTRELLAKALTERAQCLNTPQLRRVATDILHNNAATIYGIGAPA